jgi:sulfide dehydrogenase cytochrome subunit
MFRRLRLRLPVPLGLAALTLSLGVQAEGIRSAPMLVNTCAGCHGTLGVSAGDIMPTIAGMDKGYLHTVLDDYKTGLRPSTIMGRIMRGYSDQEILAIASFFAAQPWVSTDRVADAARVHQGREIHERACESCHADGGREQKDESPRLAGQWADYTRYALEACRAQGKRCDPRKMGERVMTLSDGDLEALASFYESEK